MLKEKFERLFHAFDKKAHGQEVNLESVFRDSIEFFQQLKRELQTATPEERKDLMHMVQEMNDKINEESYKICSKTGMSEQQLMEYAENPNNFSEHQWRTIQKGKGEMLKVGQQIGRIIRTEEGSLEQTTEPEPVNKIHPPVHKIHRPKRGSWTKG